MRAVPALAAGRRRAGPGQFEVTREALPRVQLRPITAICVSTIADLHAATTRASVETELATQGGRRGRQLEAALLARRAKAAAQCGPASQVCR